MTAYAVKVDFGSDANPDEVQGWFDMLMESMPPGSDGRVVIEPTVLNVEDLDEAHIGAHVRANLPGGWNVEGQLEGVFPSGNGVARTLIIDGRAYTTSYGLVTIGEWLN
jgi:hypothetical protein